MTKPQNSLEAQISNLTDRCVMCGMCSSHCPTYQLFGDENESPRGRIALIRGLASGQLTADTHAQAHIDHCLLCRNCEKKCPSGVEYAQIYNLGRQLQPQPSNWLNNFAVRRHWRQWPLALTRLAQRIGLTRLPLFGRAETARRLLPRELAPAFRDFSQPTTAQVNLFTGCANESLDSNSITACQRILSACGIEVATPAQQQCCGALAQHSGDTQNFAQLQQQNLAAFDNDLPIIFLATGCGATLKDYPRLFADRAAEACHYLSQLEQLRSLQLRPLPKNVAIHQPCSHRNVIGQPQAVERLLAHIPDIKLITPGASGCCGAGGSNMLSQPDIAQRLGQQTLDQLLAAKPDIIVSTNIGCALHLAGQLRQRGLDTELLHPLVLFHRQLE
ncbi:MAG: heterodisulfide reductase-related iron-sulfur binding cluster [Gammaproteobacteria bacterium]|nr:heterodisulfide reductase-related iron-sulfur binding cluster [Gammaproteobacteria bacterium]